MALSFTGCGDFYLEDSNAFLPPVCDDAFYHNPEKKQLLTVAEPDVEEHHDNLKYDNGLIVTTHSRTSRSLLTTTRGISGHRSPEAQQRSFELLLRTHMNRFNQRLSMLESNTLDMKESLEITRQQHRTFLTQLKAIARVFSPVNRTDKVNELATKYTNIETRLSKLEHKFEILIDGFTTLAQEIDKLKRAHRTSRLPQHHGGPPGIATTLIPALTTTQEKRTSAGRKTVSPKTLRAPPTISTLNEDSQSRRNSSKQMKSIQANQEIKSIRKDIVATPNKDNKQRNKSLKRATVAKTSTSDYLNRNLTTSNASLHHSQQKRKNASSRLPRVLQKVTSEKHHDSGAKENSTSTQSFHSLTRLQANKSATKFQIPPPALTKIPQFSKPQKDVHVPSRKSVIMPFKQNTNLVVTRMPSLSVQTKRGLYKTRPSRTNPSDLPSREHGGTARETNQPNKDFAYTTASSKPAHISSVQPPKPKGKIASPRKSAQKKISRSFNILDILMQNKKGQKRPKIKQDLNLHIVLGRLAIPVKILPDY